MKKPSLRFRQVFEHPTHFKVTRPLGNPIKIAKQGLSPQLMGRLRKFADGTPEEPVQPPTAADEQNKIDLLEELSAQAPQQVDAVVDEFRPRGEAVSGLDLSLPSRITPVGPLTPPPEPLKYAAALTTPTRITKPTKLPAEIVPSGVFAQSARPAEAADLEIPEPVAKEPAEIQPTATTTAPAQTAAAPAPAASTPTIEDIAQQRVDEYTRQRELAMDTQEQAQRDLFNAEREAQDTREEEARREYQRRMGALAGAQRAEQEATAEKPMGARDVLSAIGSALSVAAGAFATGMTGMPNFALQIYNAGVDEALKRARENRQSAYNKAIQAGVDAADAEKYWRAQQDKTMALALQEKAQTVGNAEARVKFLDAAQQFYGKARKEEAEVQKTIAEASKLTAEAKSVPLKDQTAALEVQRKATADYMDALNEANKIKVTDAASLRDYNAAIYKANKQYEADMAEITAKKPAEFVEKDNEYNTLMDVFKAQGAKGAAKRIEQTFSVDGVKLLARDKTRAQSEQKFWDGFSKQEATLNDLLDSVKKLPAGGVALTPAQKAGVKALAAKFAVAYPQLEGFQRALSVADKQIVVDFLGNPGGLFSGAFGTTVAALEKFKDSVEEEKQSRLQNAAVEGDPNLAKLTSPDRRRDRGVTFQR